MIRDNPNITVKERNLVKGALRRVFSRSDLRRFVLNTVDLVHEDPNRSRVKKWSLCPVCKNPTPKYLMQVDHKEPLVPLDKALEDMTWDEVMNRLWCNMENLTPMCKECHTQKTKEERAQRKTKRGKK